MTANTSFVISYDGEALYNHLMDVRDLAPALLSIGQLFDAANKILNDDKVTMNVKVKALNQGSFEISFLAEQGIISQIASYLSSDYVTSVVNLKELIFGGIGLIYVIKKLEGKKPKKITDLKDGFILIDYENGTLTAPLKLLRLFPDLSIREAVYEILKPLNRDGIDSLVVKEDSKEIQRINKSDLPFFEVPEIEDNMLLESVREAAYSIVSLAFKESNKWRLYDGNATISVLIKDSDFLSKVDRNLISFTKGDVLICEVKVTQWQTMQGLKTEYEVLKVKEHKSVLRQIDLFGD